MTNDAIEAVEVSERVALWRGWLLATGVVLLGIGAFTFLTTVSFDKYPGIAAWLAGAIILHDGVGAMVVFGVTIILRRFDRVIPFVVLAIVQGAAVVAVIVTVLVLPEIVKHMIGTANPSILPLDYTRNLVLFYAGLAVTTVCAIAVALILTRGRATRKS